MNKLKINNHEISKENTPFIIAEAGINHNGSVEKAVKMVKTAKNAGVSAIKFQTFKAHELISDSSLTYTYTSQGKSITESQLDLFKRCELSNDDFYKIKKTCDEEKIIFLSTPQNKSDLDFLLELDISAIKVGSDDFTNIPLLKYYSKTKLPILISCGMTTLKEIKTTLTAIGTLDGYPTALLLTTSEYPTPPQNVNLQKLRTLSEKFPDIPLGYSDHTQGNLASPIAISFGACIFEKHFTLDNSLPGPDHWFSSNPSNLEVWSDSIKTSYQMMGYSEILPTESEIKMKAIARRSIVALNDIDVGETINENNIGLRRPGTGLPPKMFELILGKKATKKIEKFTILCEEDFA
jgi:sialic acid synthase SpsE